MQIIFEVQTEYGIYRDALYFDDNGPMPDDATIEAMKAERVQNWIAVITTPPVVEPLPEMTDG